MRWILTNDIFGCFVKSLAFGFLVSVIAMRIAGKAHAGADVHWQGGAGDDVDGGDGAGGGFAV